MVRKTRITSYKTTSFYEAAFLCYKGLDLVSIEELNPRRSQFVFKDTPQRAKLVEAFVFGQDGASEVLVDARKFIMVLKSLKDKLYSRRN